MLRAILQDMLRIPGLTIVTTWDRRLPIELGITAESLIVVPVSHPTEESEVFRRLCREVDGTYVIAPELDNELLRRVSVAGDSATVNMTTGVARRNYNCTPDAITLCGDKWALFHHLTREGIPTIPTCRFDMGEEFSSLAWPRVLKLRYGAGSHSMQLVSSTTEWEPAIRQFDSTVLRNGEVIAQPYIRGQSISVGVIIDGEGAIHILPTADQNIDPSREFVYQGGRIPSAHWDRPLNLLLRQMLSTIPGLLGYVGVDLLVPDSSPQTPLIVEINPRLTTSYVGYQKLCRDNLATFWIGDQVSERIPRWLPGTVVFDPAGEFQWEP